MPRHGTARGFSLLEVLVSIAIFAMAFIVILSTYANILSSYQHIQADREVDEDVKFARAALLAEPDIQKAQDGDEFDSTGERHVRWSSTITPSDTIADLFSVEFECEVSAPGQPGGEPEKVTQTFMVLRPTWSDPAERDKLLQATKAQIADLQGKLPNGFIAGTPPSPNGGGGGGGFGGGGGRGGRGGPGGAGGGRGGRGGGPGGAGGAGGGNFGNGGGRGGNGNGGGGGGRFGNGGGGGGGGNGNFQRGGGNGGNGNGGGGRGAGGAGGNGGFFRGGGAGGGAGGAAGGGR